MDVAAVLVPIKAFAAAKGRLDGVLDATARADLARRLAATVLAAADPLPVWVVCDDDEVAAFAAAHGAGVIRQPLPGLNPGVQHAVAELAAAGIEVVVVAHADLPGARDLARLATLAGGRRAAVVPDRHGEGTNVLAVPSAAGFTFAYGPGSLAAHRAEAERLGLELEIVDDEALAWDIDTPEDLAPEVTSPGAPRPA